MYFDVLWMEWVTLVWPQLQLMISQWWNSMKTNEQKKSLILSSLACVLCNCSYLQIKTIESLDNFNWTALKTLPLKLFSPRFQIADFKHLKCRSDKSARRHYEIKFHCFQIISLGFFPLYKSSILSKIFIKKIYEWEKLWAI